MVVEKMKKDIPHITFNPVSTDSYGFEIVSIEHIASNKNRHTHDPELPHQLKFYNLIFFIQGSGRHFIDFKWFPVQENSLVYLTKDQISAFEFSEKLKGYCIIFTEEYFVNSFSNLTNDFVFRLFNPELFSPILQIAKNSDFLTYFNLLLKEYGNPHSFNHKTIINSLLTILISKAEYLKQNLTFHISDSAKLVLYQNFVSLLEKNLTQSRSANFYAKELAVSYKHLNTVCKELINKTAKNVIDDFIILQAKRNLINSTTNSSELAYKLGFEDPTNFTKYFKKNTGLTPKSFIQSLQKD